MYFIRYDYSDKRFQSPFFLEQQFSNLWLENLTEEKKIQGAAQKYVH